MLLRCLLSLWHLLQSCLLELLQLLLALWQSLPESLPWLPSQMRLWQNLPPL
jgi:hypothetical protein